MSRARFEAWHTAGEERSGVNRRRGETRPALLKSFADAWMLKVPIIIPKPIIVLERKFTFDSNSKITIYK